MLLAAFAKAIHNLFMPGILKLFVICLLAYGVGWLGFSVLIGTLIGALVSPEHGGWFAGTLGTLGSTMIAWFLFPLLFPILVSFFDDQMAETIERADYPQLPAAAPPFWPTFANDVLFSLKAIGLNLLCLPLYLIPLVNLCVYFGLNGWLLGAQFFRMSAGRRVSQARAQELIAKARPSIFLAGVLISFCGTIPLVNLAAPVLGVATMLHLFHAANGAGKVEII